MTLLAQTSILSTLITLAIAISVFVQKRKTNLQRFFGYLNINLAVCIIAAFLISFGYNTGKVGSNILMLAVLGLPVAFLHFFALFVPELEKAFGNILRFCYPLSAAFAILAMTPMNKSKIFLTLEAVFVLTVLILCNIIIWLHYHAASTALEKSRLKPVYLGGFGTVLLIVLDLMSYSLDWPYVFLANLGVAVYMYYLLQLISSAKPFDLTEVFAKGAILGVLGLIIAVIYWLMIFWVDTQQLGAFFISVLVASVVILILYDPLKNEIESRTASWLFSQRREMRLLLNQLHKNLVNIIDLDRTAIQVMKALSRSKRVTDASIFYVQRSGAGYECSSYHGEAPLPVVSFENSASLLHELQSSKQPLVRRDVDFQVNSPIFSWDQNGGFHERERQQDILRTLQKLRAEVCLPCISSSQEVVGFLCLGNERFDDGYSSGELEVMMMVAAQIATTIENSRLFEDVKERERLAVLGEMSAGLAHEIRNPLGAIKGAAQLLNPDKMKSSEKEMVNIIVEEVDRLNGVVVQFLDYARPFYPNYEPCNINELLEKTLLLAKASEESRDFKINVTFFDKLPEMQADAEKLKQVFLNLIRNAFDSMDKGQTLSITTNLRTENELSFVAIEFQDEGPGIPKEVMQNIFIPFFTTKTGGTGLGLSICQRIIKYHQGEILVESTGKGTCFRILLPVVPADR